MNCRFCGAYIPDGYNTCELCGRRIDERPMGELLSENQPESFAHGGNKPKEDINPRRIRKGVFLPLLDIVIAVLGWGYLLHEKRDAMNQIYEAIFGGTLPALLVETGYRAAMLPAIAAALTILGIIGLITLIKRTYNRVKYRELIYG